MHIIVYANTNTKVRSPGESFGLWCNTGFHRNIIKFSATCALQIGRFNLSVIQPPIACAKVPARAESCEPAQPDTTSKTGQVCQGGDGQAGGAQQAG